MSPGPPPADADDPTPPPPVPRLSGRALGGFVVGAALLAVALVFLARQSDVVAQAWRSVRSASPTLLAALLLLPLANLLVVSLSFWVLMRREGRVGPGEMTALIGAAWLMNFAPLRPGLLGRIAYHRTVNGVPVARSVRVTVAGLAASAVAVLISLAIAALLGPRAAPIAWIAALSAPLLAASAGAILVPSPARPYLAVFALRFADTLLWAARYALVFALIGSPIALPGAVAVSAVCQAAMLVPLAGNGLGLREWAAGLTAALLPQGFVDTAGNPAAVGLAADVVNRATELLVAVPVGLISSAWLAHRLRSSRPA